MSRRMSSPEEKSPEVSAAAGTGRAAGAAASKDETAPPSRFRLPIIKAAPKDAGKPAFSEARPRLWRSLEEEAAGRLPEAGLGEFPPGASELDGVNRRSFIQLMGGTLALAGVSVGCRKPPEKIVPYVRRPPEVVPGNPLHFATAYALEGYGTGLLATSYEGRPTKIEGNPEHPDSLGRAGVFEQGLVLGLYDEDRAKQIRHKGQPAAWISLQATIADLVKTAPDGGARVRFLSGPTTSPLIAELRQAIQAKLPKAKFSSFNPVASDGLFEGAEMLFGRPLETRLELSAADVILALDADVLGEGPGHLRHALQFAERREPGERMNRLYVAEPVFSITGSMADHRKRVRAGDIPALLFAVIAELANKPGFTELGRIGNLASGASGADKVDRKWAAAVARDLEKNRGRGLVIAGRRQPAYVHAAVGALNFALGNVGKTVAFAEPSLLDPLQGPAVLAKLAEEIAAGQVDVLVMTGSNPVYTAPADLKFGPLIARVPTSLYLGLYEDETAAAVTTFVPASHVLESWGDSRATDGTVTFTQPLIAPLWAGLSEPELLAAFLGEAHLGAHGLLKRSWSAKASTLAKAANAMPGGPLDFESTWEKWLADGLIAGSGTDPVAGLTVSADNLLASLGKASSKTSHAEGLEIAFVPDPKVFDGRFGNNPWLQELPDPITKVTWDNAAFISKTTADALNFVTGDVAIIESRKRTIEAPVLVVPGHANDAITLSLGYGRTGAESVARGIGANANAIRVSEAPWFERGIVVSKSTRSHTFALTQDHWSMSPDGRETPPPAVATTLHEVENPHSEFHEEIETRRGPITTMHKPWDYSKEQYQWGMAIDLNKCTGCNACVMACQAENNIPTVGKAQVLVGREMQWIRIDRYFSGEIEDAEIINQPLACVHCETAPCEYVCPVNATAHSDEGLNEMAYNRCIGTRYCSNNCPYKVRRFNFLDYHPAVPAASQMGMNPDVTVRSRGIMEKCTYCVQRIERKRIDSRIEKRLIKDGELKTACEQTCPSDAIVFGTLSDPNSRVSKAHKDERRYDLLHEIGTRPRTAYLARVRNLNPELA